MLTDQAVSVLVARDESIVGCVALIPDQSVPSGHVLARLYVAPERWAQGVGALLHDAALTEATTRGLARLNLWVLEANQRARAMYERRSWALVPSRKLVNGNAAEAVFDVLYERPLVGSGVSADDAAST